MKQAPVIVVQLIHLQGPLKGQIQEFTEPVILIGRHPQSLLKFPPDLAVVSRKHAEIVRDGNRFKLTDLSTNGTYVNGKRVTEAYLKNGDVLTFAEGGPKVSFLSQIREEQQQEPSLVAVPPPRPEREEYHRPPVEPPRAPQPVLKEPQKSPQPVLKEPEPSPQPANVPLVFQYGPTLRSYKQLPVNIGKHPNCHFVIDHPEVLDMHAQIFYAQNEYWVKDLTGRSLVLVNGRPIGIKASPLNTTDLLALGPQGPVFRFLGEGRLAEVEQSIPDSAADHPGGEDQDVRRSPEERKTDQEHKPFFKKLFK